MASIYKSERGEAAIQERYLQFLDRWPVANKQLRIATRGGEGVAIVGDGPEVLIRSETVATEDTTGAGDTFLGGFLAAWRGGDVKPAIEKGMAAARALLMSRTPRLNGERP